MRKALAFALIGVGLVFAAASTAPPEELDASTSRRDGGSSGTDSGSTGQDSGSSSTTCMMTEIFYDQSSTVCSDGFCGIDQNYLPVCYDAAASAGGANYAQCGTQGECPVGGSCFNDGAGGTVCYPFCSPTHPICPDNGICAYGIQGGPTDLMLCTAADDCDGVDNTGCDSGEGCYVVTATGNLCLTPGTAVAGEACNSLNDCAPGFACMGSTAPGSCMPLCHLADGDADCDPGETCTNIQHAVYGGCQSGGSTDAG